MSDEQVSIRKTIDEPLVVTGHLRQARDRIDQLTRDLAAAREELERERKPWRFQLITAPVPRKQEPGDYPDLSETYDLSLVDTGHSERVYLLGSDELYKRITEAEKQLAAANTTVEKCKQAIDDEPELPLRTEKDIADFREMLGAYRTELAKADDHAEAFLHMALVMLVQATKQGIRERAFPTAARATNEQKGKQ